MKKNTLKRSLSCIVVVSLLVMIGYSSSVATAATIEKLVVNPSTTEPSGETDQITIAAKASGQNVTYTWELVDESPGRLEGPTTEPVVYYLPPETLESGHNVAKVKVTVRDEQGEDTEEVIFTLIGVKSKITPSHKGDLAKQLSGLVTIDEGSKVLKGHEDSRFEEELKRGNAIKIGTDSPKKGENVFVVSKIKDNETLELDELHSTGVDTKVPIFTDHELLVVTDGAEEPKLVIDKSGNVGIRTTEPKATLDVNGTIKFGTHSGGMEIWDEIEPNSGDSCETACGNGYCLGAYLDGESEKQSCSTRSNARNCICIGRQ